MLNMTKQLVLLGVLLTGIFSGCSTSSSDNAQSSSSSYESSAGSVQSSSSLPLQSSSSLSAGSVASSLDNASSSTFSQSSSSVTYSVSSSHAFSSVAPVASSSSQAPVIRSTPDNPFAKNYTDAIPADATKLDYDERRFGVITGVIYAADETTPLEGVRVIIKDHSEYGSVLSDAEGRYQIATEASGIQVLDFDKSGYTPLQRRVTTRWNQIATAPKITMLAVDDKSTTITLASAAVQTHTASTIDDERGERAVTIVFDNVHKATVINKDGSSYTLETMNVRATEFTTPQSMPATLPPTSAFTYCIDVTVDGVDKDAMVHFDTNVSFFVDNFLGAPVGTVVPVGYYDRTQALWVAMPNGIVVTLLDGNGDGTVDGVDADDDGVADDINGNGSTYDEAAGLGDKTRFSADSTFTMFYSDHFTSIDANYGWREPPFISPPLIDGDNLPLNENNPIKNDCYKSYVAPSDRSFHEDITIPGTSYTLWYNSKNTKGYHLQKNISLKNWIGSLGTMVAFDIAGQEHTKIFQPQTGEKEATFFGIAKIIWGM